MVRVGCWLGYTGETVWTGLRLSAAFHVLAGADRIVSVGGAPTTVEAPSAILADSTWGTGIWMRFQGTDSSRSIRRLLARRGASLLAGELRGERSVSTGLGPLGEGVRDPHRAATGSRGARAASP